MWQTIKAESVHEIRDCPPSLSQANDRDHTNPKRQRGFLSTSTPITQPTSLIDAPISFSYDTTRRQFTLSKSAWRNSLTIGRQADRLGLLLDRERTALSVPHLAHRDCSKWPIDPTSSSS